MMRLYEYVIRPEDYTIYLDLDGVLVDFIKGASKVTGIPMKSFADWNILKKDEWQKITDAGSDFWKNLSWMKDGKELWDFVKVYNPRVLSAYPQAPKSMQNAIKGKFEWIHKNLGMKDSRIHIVKGQHKQFYAEPTAILIDDSDRNIEQFIKAGGIGILHKNTKDTIKQLKSVLK